MPTSIQDCSVGRTIQSVLEDRRTAIENYISAFVGGSYGSKNDVALNALLRQIAQYQSDYQKMRYGFVYNDVFKASTTPVLISREREQPYPDRILAKREIKSFDEIERLASRRSGLVYLHRPAKTRKEVIWFESTDLANGFIDSRDYTPTAYNLRSGISVSGDRTPLTYFDGSRKLVKEFGTDKPSKRYIYGTIYAPPKFLFETASSEPIKQHVRMQRLPFSLFTEFYLTPYLALLPQPQELPELYPYFLFLLYRNLKGLENEKTKQKVNKTLRNLEEKKIERHQMNLARKRLSALFAFSSFGYDDFTFFCFLLYTFYKKHKRLRKLGFSYDADRMLCFCINALKYECYTHNKSEMLEMIHNTAFFSDKFSFQPEEAYTGEHSLFPLDYLKPEKNRVDPISLLRTIKYYP